MQHPLSAIVFDTNVFGGGRLDYRTLARWAEACASNGAELWVPQIVAWEWTQHADDELAKLEQARGQERRALDKLGFDVPAPPDLPASAQVMDQIAASGARIIALEPDDAFAALRDQVRQRGPATRVKTVKTGAADSAWARSIAANAAGLEQLTVVCNDHTAATFLEEIIPASCTLTVVSHLGEIQQLLDHGRAATGLEASRFDSVVAAWFADDGIDEMIHTHLGEDWTPDLPHDLEVGGWKVDWYDIEALDDAAAATVPLYSPWLDGLIAPVESTVQVEIRAVRGRGTAWSQAVHIQFDPAEVTFRASLVGVNKGSVAVSADRWHFELDPDAGFVPLV